MVPLRDDGERLACSGLTSREELIRVVRDLQVCESSAAGAGLHHGVRAGAASAPSDFKNTLVRSGMNLRLGSAAYKAK